MAKMKTKSAAKKRFKKVGGKEVKFKRAQGFRRHLLTKKSSKRKRQLRSNAYVNSVDVHRIARLMPH
jgi:large subunit ribosomal protein L35